MNLGSLQAPEGARKKRKRVGRGEGSGHGGTSTRGHKGQKSRAGGFHKRGFEGGQMTLTRRLPKRGFVNPFKVRLAVVNVGDLNRLEKNSVVEARNIKILGGGEITTPLVFKGTRFSGSARKKILAAGGRIIEEAETAGEVK